MNAPNDNSIGRRLRNWWANPRRSGIQLWIAPYEYRRLRFFGVGRIIGGCAAAVAGFICLSYSVYDWAAFFLVLAALNLAGGAWYLSIDSSLPARA